MVINYLGGEGFKITRGDLTVVFNPASKDSSLKFNRFGADVVISTLDNPDFNGGIALTAGDKEPFIINGPGEYEVKGVEVRGFAGESLYGGAPHLNTVFLVAIEGMQIVFLGAQSETIPLSAKQAIEEVDILFVPIGGEGVLDYAAAAKIATQLEASVVIPMHYGEIGAKDSLKLFLKEAAAENAVPQDKFTVKKKDLEGKQGEVVVLTA